MLKAFRELKISLAAKCQLLFGLALALIIAAALFAPWQRMEQLMEEMDRRTARALTEQALMEHMARHAGEVAGPLPSTRASEGGVRSEAWGEAVRSGREGVFAPRIVGVWREDLTRAERLALQRFAVAGDEDFRGVHYTRRDGEQAYRYTRGLFARYACLECHADDEMRVWEVAGPSPGGSEDVAATLLRLPPGLMGLVSVDIPSQKQTNEVLLNRVFFLAAALVAGALAILVFSLITTRFILQPVRVLQETAEKVSKGDLDVRSDISTGDEFQQLSETFNKMLTNLSRTEAKLREANKVLDSRLSQLSETNVALAETNRLKSEFLANVSHELKTPLNSILGFADLLRKAAAAADDTKSYRYAQNIQSAGNNLLVMITDLLDLAKVEAGRMEVRPQEFVLSELFERLVNTLRPLTEPKGVTISTEIESAIPQMKQDWQKLQQILYNFLSNAIKFSPQGGNITMRAVVHAYELDSPSPPVLGGKSGVGAAPGGGITPTVPMAAVREVRISVTDQGPGIEPSKTRVIFEKFRQLDGGVTRQHGGTGLGLAISKELTALLGGTIGVESAPDEGATFWVVVPTRIDESSTELKRS